MSVAGYAWRRASDDSWWSGESCCIIRSIGDLNACEELNYRAHRGLVMVLVSTIQILCQVLLISEAFSWTKGNTMLQR